jgi:hypothetical protein
MGFEMPLGSEQCLWAAEWVGRFVDHYGRGHSCRVTTTDEELGKGSRKRHNWHMDTRRARRAGQHIQEPEVSADVFGWRI